jgi:HD-like signal output (HDOD) protein
VSIQSLELELHHQILDRAEALRPLSSTVVRLASAVADPDSDVDDIVAILREDPNLTAAILREANSAASGSTTEITTIDAAVTRLGSGRVLTMATDASLDIEVPPQLVSYADTAADLRKQSTYMSYVAEAIQNLNRSEVGPEVVTAAFLSDLGKVLLDNHLDPRFFAALRQAEFDIVGAERELAAVDHAELGALLMELWKVPQTIADAIRYSHTPQFQDDTGPAVIAIAHHVASQILETESETTPEALEWSFERLGLTIEQVTDRAVRFLERAGLLD